MSNEQQKIAFDEYVNDVYNRTLEKINNLGYNTLDVKVRNTIRADVEEKVNEKDFRAGYAIGQFDLLKELNNE